jgi:hypothetical protein
MRSTGELLYLLMVIGAFTIFAIALAWAERTWKPKQTAQQPHALPRAAE